MAPRRSTRVSEAAQKKAIQIATASTPTSTPTLTKTRTKTKAKTKITTGKPENKPNTTRNRVTKTTTKKPKATPAKKEPVEQTTAKVDVENIPSLPPPPSTPKRNRTTVDSLNRPVDPHRTTATLLTPRGSHITAYPNNIEDASPSKTGLPRPTTTVGNLLADGIAHLLAVDPRMKAVIDKFPSAPFGPSDLTEEIDPFHYLTSGIIGQQVSGAAAKSIKKKFVTLFLDKNKKNNNTNTNIDEEPEKEEEKDDNDLTYKVGGYFPTPQEVLEFDLPTLRTAGLSQRKAEYILGLAEKFANGELSARMLLTATDEEVLEKLIAVRGLGKWSVEMFSCFGLKRMDVFSTGDLGVQRGMASYVGRDVSKLKGKSGGKFKYMAEKDMLEIAAPFSPYRSLFMWYMWRWENVDVSVMM
ncbi:3-methyladenine DNA glycosylase [Myotisia sp. PD_48]|nr:3-methyladenine DNA glycosylase [Myotisia sp. PD_48]